MMRKVLSSYCFLQSSLKIPSININDILLATFLVFFISYCPSSTDDPPAPKKKIKASAKDCKALFDNKKPLKIDSKPDKKAPAATRSTRASQGEINDSNQL